MPTVRSFFLCSTRHGYNSTLSKEVVYRLESSLSNISTMVEELAMDMFTVSCGCIPVVHFMFTSIMVEELAMDIFTVRRVCNSWCEVHIRVDVCLCAPDHGGGAGHGHVHGELCLIVNFD
jgi:hypothetical protein